MPRLLWGQAITSFSIATPTRTIPGTITDNNISIIVPNGTDVTHLVPTVTVSEAGLILSPASGVAPNFTNSSPVTYTVTKNTYSEPKFLKKSKLTSSQTKSYTVTVKVASLPGKGKLVPFKADGVNFNMVLVPIPKGD